MVDYHKSLKALAFLGIKKEEKRVFLFFSYLNILPKILFPFLRSLLCIQHAVVHVLHTILALKSPLFKGAEGFFLFL